MKAWLIALFSFFLSAYGGDFDSLSGRVDIAGGTAHIPVLKEVAKQVMKENEKITITIAGGGSGVGVQQVGLGLVDIGTTGRDLSSNEKVKFKLQSYAFAIDGIAVVVHPSNPIRNLTTEQLKEIFFGSVDNWKRLGGADCPIHVFGRDDASGTREVFDQAVLGEGFEVADMVIVPSNGAMRRAVAMDKSAIGYLSIGFVDESVKSVSLNGVQPSQENALKGTYPVCRKLYMHTWRYPDQLTQRFVDYVMGPKVAPIIRKHGYIPTCKE
jgi:phosphate transport system substrate-binding protein